MNASVNAVCKNIPAANFIPLTWAKAEAKRLLPIAPGVKFIEGGSL